MSVLSYQSIRDRQAGMRWYREINGQLYQTHQPAATLKITPFFPDKQLAYGMSYGLSAAGYDIRIGSIDREAIQDAFGVPTRLDRWTLDPGGDFVLLGSMEYMEIPDDLIAMVHDKSTLARRGLALQNTVLEPGWKGHITLELSNHGKESIEIFVGQPIAQVVFHELDFPSARPYAGKYQNQEAAPVHAKFEGDPLVPGK